jgi:hypothetical protein
MTDRPKHISLPMAALVSGRSEMTISRWRRAGLLGSVKYEPGTMIGAKVEVAALERLAGVSITNQQLEAAHRQWLARNADVRAKRQGVTPLFRPYTPFQSLAAAELFPSEDTEAGPTPCRGPVHEVHRT